MRDIFVSWNKVSGFSFLHIISWISPIETQDLLFTFKSILFFTLHHVAENTVSFLAVSHEDFPNTMLAEELQVCALASQQIWRWADQQKHYLELLLSENS